MDPAEIASLRTEYAARGLRRADLDPDPVKQFALWFTAAVETGLRDANAMTLATIGPGGAPAARVVLLKGFNEDGFTFFTNYESDKGRQLEENPACAAVFFWPQLERQVRLEGRVARVSREESERYFHARPRGSQLGASVSRQSRVIRDRAVLEAELEKLTAQHEGNEVPLPSNWGGYRILPDRVEFWQGRPNRLHDRFRYRRDAGEEWSIERLAP